MLYIQSKVEVKLKGCELDDNQKNALLDASFNLGPGKLSQFDMEVNKCSGENFFLKFMGDGDAISKRRFGEALLFSEDSYIHFDVLKVKSLEKAKDEINNSTKPKDEKTDK